MHWGPGPPAGGTAMAGRATKGEGRRGRVEWRGGIGQNISHLFGPGTTVTVLIGPVWFLGLFVDLTIGGISERNPKPIELDFVLNFRPLRTYFEEEEAISTTSVIAGGDITGGSEAERAENVRAHTYTQTPNTQTPNTQPRGLGWRIHCGVEVTELSTNKQHSLPISDYFGTHCSCLHL